ncbi:methionine adenosyltransferase [Candidatus Nitrosotenuis chungbukensis]|uniref:methionine adenosyltransferase n=1 Tax=Candidatus Nitrosotenuis chungbukensis TaxID=1353246 RepID=UPI0005B2E9C1|nr:methionine adenosyltransferase [Candidatus Nitrosotenuis chungbukensis]WKT58665.1 methionine adenosyltransferase [Candidatus Nitrosotenuis chungbukensis]
MSDKIFVETVRATPTFKKRFEFVERKGLGHPDTICDLVMNKVSIELSKLYLKETGIIQHHNMDKTMLVAGQTENKFGGGKILKPMKLVMGDRATTSIDGRQLPIGDFAITTAKSWFEKNLRYVKDEHIEYQLELGKSSGQLRSIFKSPKSFASNDTSVLVGYAPYTETESVVLGMEQYINSKKFKAEFPASGEDVKVMGFRNGDCLDLTVAIAFVDSFVDSQNDYFKKKRQMLDAITEFGKKKTPLKVHAAINCLDDERKGIDGVYLTVLGTSADNADSGEVGRGNKANRVISPSRPAGAEAIAGKNPVSHIGKIYNAMSFKIADEVHKNVLGFDEVFVWMYNVIGMPVNDPKAVVVQPITKNNSEITTSQTNQINEIVSSNLEKMDEFCKKLLSEQIEIA